MEQKLRRDLNIGMNLRRLRIEHGYSQESLCVELQRRGIDIGRSAYQKYEEGRLNVKISVLIALKHLYGCTYDDFFSGLCRSFIWFYTSQLVQIQIYAREQFANFTFGKIHDGRAGHLDDAAAERAVAYRGEIEIDVAVIQINADSGLPLDLAARLHLDRRRRAPGGAALCAHGYRCA